MYSTTYCSSYCGSVRNYPKSNIVKHPCVMMMSWVSHGTRQGMEAIAYFWFAVFGASAGRLLGWMLNSSEGLFTHKSGDWYCQLRPLLERHKMAVSYLGILYVSQVEIK